MVSRCRLQRAIRAVEVLEAINVPEAQQQLEALAMGAPEAQMTKDARLHCSGYLSRRTPKAEDKAPGWCRNVAIEMVNLHII